MKNQPFFGKFDIICAITMIALSPLFFGGCASSAQTDSTSEIWRVMDDSSPEEKASLTTLHATRDFAEDAETEHLERVVVGDQADAVPVRVSQITILAASAEEMEAAIEAAELTALCPHPHRASTGDRDAWICEP
ncbi:MAG: hypothetical protein U9P90_03620 [Patescibacteria group bacterium]|nr:hypothetical protein [Patescibacteria group bacterium]